MFCSLNSFTYCSHSRILLHLNFPSYYHIAGEMCNHNRDKKTTEEVVNVGDEWSMEVDLRSVEKEKRTLHWFVRGKQLKGFF